MELHDLCIIHTGTPWFVYCTPWNFMICVLYTLELHDLCIIHPGTPWFVHYKPWNSMICALYTLELHDLCIIHPGTPLFVHYTPWNFMICALYTLELHDLCIIHPRILLIRIPSIICLSLSWTHFNLFFISTHNSVYKENFYYRVGHTVIININTMTTTFYFNFDSYQIFKQQRQIKI